MCLWTMWDVTMIDLSHVLGEVLVAAVVLLSALQVWIVKEIISLKRWQVKTDVGHKEFSENSAKIDKIHEWMIATKALEEADKKLRDQLPLVMAALERQAQEMQSSRETLLVFRKGLEIQVKDVAEKIENIKTNCIRIHK